MTLNFFNALITTLVSLIFMFKSAFGIGFEKEVYFGIAYILLNQAYIINNK